MVPRGGFLLLMLRSWYMLISFMLMLLGVVFVFIRSKTSSGFVEQLWGHKVNRQHSQSHVFFSPALTGVDFARCHLIFPFSCYDDIEELILSRFPPPKLLLGFMIVRHSASVTWHSRDKNVIRSTRAASLDSFTHWSIIGNFIWIICGKKNLGYILVLNYYLSRIDHR